MSRPGRHEEGARTRERVLQAAAGLIASQGYAATSIAQISERAQANPTSIRWAFGNKEGLLAAVMERSADAFFEQLEPPARQDVWQSLEGLSIAFAGGPEFLRLLLVLSLERREGDPRVLEAARSVRSSATARLAAGYEQALEIDNAFQRRAISRELARFTLMLLDGVFIASQIEPGTTDLDRAFKTIAIGVRATAERLTEQARKKTYE